MAHIFNTNLLDRKEFKKSLDLDINPNAFYIAIVENTNDVYKIGRVQIRIPAIHRNRFKTIVLYI